jgi:excisionase family DNA binding protein
MYLTVREVAVRLNVSLACIYMLVTRHELPHVRIGVGRGTIRIREEDLANYIAQRNRGPAEPRSSVPRPKLKHLHL